MTVGPKLRSRLVANWLIVGICVAVAVLAAFGYTAAREWRRNSELLIQERADKMADLLGRALTRDMRGVQENILRSVPSAWITGSQHQDINDLVATAFARYPYPESFFCWSERSGVDEAVFFTRTDSPPPWLPASETSPPFPVRTATNPALSGALVGPALAAGTLGRRFAVFEITTDDEPYQVVAIMAYETSRRERVVGVFGFMVNLRWAREHYLRGIMSEVQQVLDPGDGLDIAIEDDRGIVVAGAHIPKEADLTAVRRVRPLFFDPSLVSLGQPENVSTGDWTVRVSAADHPAYAFAIRGAGRTLTFTVAAAMAFAVGLLLAARAIRASADLAQVRADFVASVTHELKTPLSTIRAISESLSRSHVGNHGIREYAQILDQESGRLMRLVENLLAYSRVTDASAVYTFEPIDLCDLIDDIVRRFRPQLDHRAANLQVDIPSDLPPVSADRAALELALDNLVDNALRYSGEQVWIGISARSIGSFIRIAVRDRGIGIAQDQLGRVEGRFVRGRSPASGSGLGLTIAGRIIRDHGGALGIESQEGYGTTVHVDLPIPVEAS